MKFIKYWLPVLVWAFFIFLGSSVPAVKVSSNNAADFLAHKVAHLLEYAILYLLIYRVLSQGQRGFDKKEIALAILLVSLYGGSDEFHQRFTPGRESRLRDVFIDFLGGILGAGIWRYYPKVRKILSI